ncbi:MAG: NAD-dependent protein deacylase [Erysipelotrichaceae bacterium]|nr:NAD-dependent protein deacylase [Erysipelotrichaceae bacterium]MDY5252081.1 NAD-dependent protein deacylase [Erysipelotrichaceae bacterium]
MDKITQLQNIIDHSSKIVFFTGAGVSCDSGIPDFRSQDGLYHQQYAYPPETILSHRFFWQNTAEFYRFYRNKMIYPQAKPNITHKFIAQLEKQGKCLGTITQNIDGLHQMANSRKVIELHGSIHRNYCTKCHKFYELSTIINSVSIPTCECHGIIKPDVVLYEEALDEKNINDALSLILACDTLIVCGTSLQVYPAASFVNYYQKDQLVLINKTCTPFDQKADLVINQPLDQVLSQLVIR